MLSNTNETPITIIGGGLAGCEAAWQLARCGIDSVIYEMRPDKRSPAHTSDGLAELVCSNSLRGEGLTGAVGLLKEEMRRAGSLIIEAADATQVPAGGALAVDREEFSRYIEEKLTASPHVTVVREELHSIPSEGRVIIASGPLTSDRLAEEIAGLTGREHLYFYDAIAPIVEADSIDMEKVWAASRYDKGDADYLNCPMTEDEYKTFVQALNDGEKVATKDFEQMVHFEGCMPVEEMARRGEMTLAFGPMKPVGLPDPKTGKEPFAVIQLRQENRHKTLFNLVGFQTKLKYPEQERIFRTIPGLETVRFARLGSMHRNTFIHAPSCLNSQLQLKSEPRLSFAGQITGVEGYVESAACGMLAGIFAAMELHDAEPSMPSKTTACGALLNHLDNTETDNFQPMNVNYGLFPPLEGKRLRKRRERRLAMAERGLASIGEWIDEIGVWRSNVSG